MAKKISAQTLKEKIGDVVYRLDSAAENILEHTTHLNSHSDDLNQLDVQESTAAILEELVQIQKTLRKLEQIKGDL